MAESSNTLPFTLDLATQIIALTSQVQENTIHFMALEDKNGALRRKNRNLLECLSTIETTP